VVRYRANTLTISAYGAAGWATPLLPIKGEPLTIVFPVNPGRDSFVEVIESKSAATRLRLLRLPPEFEARMSTPTVEEEGVGRVAVVPPPYGHIAFLFKMSATVLPPERVPRNREVSAAAICMAYDAKISRRHTVGCRATVDADLYYVAFPELNLIYRARRLERQPAFIVNRVELWRQIMRLPSRMAALLGYAKRVSEGRDRRGVIAVFPAVIYEIRVLIS